MNRFTNAMEVFEIWKKIKFINSWEIKSDGSIELTANINKKYQLFFRGNVNEMGDLESRINDEVREDNAENLRFADMGKKYALNGGSKNLIRV